MPFSFKVSGSQVFSCDWAGTELPLWEGSAVCVGRKMYRYPGARGCLPPALLLQKMEVLLGSGLDPGKGPCPDSASGRRHPSDGQQQAPAPTGAAYSAVRGPPGSPAAPARALIARLYHQRQGRCQVLITSLSQGRRPRLPV